MSEDPKIGRSSSSSFGSASGGYQQPALFEAGSMICFTYQVEALLARGGMGEVYKTRHSEIGTEHAIKIVRPDLANSEKIMELFRREASVLRTVRDDAIVGYDGVLRDEEGRVYLVMEFVDGPSLTSFLEDRVLSLDEVRRLRDRLARGLAAAHDKGVIHRDMSPDNVILGQGDLEQAKIIDFGIAKLADSSATTIIGDDFAGRYAYASPEQIGLYGGQVDVRSDIYSLGLVLATAATGKALNMGEISESLVSVIEARKRVPDFSSVPPELRPELGSMLEPDPADRPQSMREVIGLDRRLRDAEAMAAEAAAPEAEAKIPAAPLAAEPAARPSAGGGESRRRWLAPALAAGVTAIAAGGYFVWQESARAPETPVARAPAESASLGLAAPTEQAAPAPAPAPTPAAAEPLASDEVALAGEAVIEAASAAEIQAAADAKAAEEARIAAEAKAAAEAQAAADAKAAEEARIAAEAKAAAEAQAAADAKAAEEARIAAEAKAAAEAQAAADAKAAEEARIAAEAKAAAEAQAAADAKAAEEARVAAEAKAAAEARAAETKAAEEARIAAEAKAAAEAQAAETKAAEEARIAAEAQAAAEARAAETKAAEEATIAAEPASQPQEEQVAALPQASAADLQLAMLRAAEAELTAEQRREIQRDLRALGHYEGTIDGSFGPGTRTAIAKYQKVAALDATGYLLPEARAALAEQAAPARAEEQRLAAEKAAAEKLAAETAAADRAVAEAAAARAQAAARTRQPATTGTSLQAALPNESEVDRLVRQAEGGDVLAQASLGQRYYRGDGVRRDLAEAVRWTLEAARQGEARAQSNLGFYYMKGEGTDRNPAEAVRWWRAAAEQGLPQAQYNLGVLYEQGQGVQVDYGEAAKWYDLAAAQGDRNASERLAGLKRRGLVPAGN
ncbi:MAG: protein kinase [Kiloniellaceae bacterium]|nr:protein kinase [Kiloniellaceae bacterium]